MANTNQQNNSSETEEELIPVGDGVKDLHQEEDQRVSSDANNDDDDDDIGNESDDSDDSSEGKSEEEIARQRAFRRKRRRNKKENLRRDRMELEYLRQRNLELERRVEEGLSHVDSRLISNELTQVEQRISALDQQIALADSIIATAYESDQPGRGADIVRAQNSKQELMAAKNQLLSFKNQRSQVLRDKGNGQQTANPGANGQQTQNPQLSEVQRRRATQWFNENRWYNPEGKNQESRTTMKIDNDLTREGFDPSTEEYWDEFEDRVEAALPHLYGQSENSDDDEGEEEELTPVNRRNTRTPNRNSADTRKGNNGKTRPRGPMISVGGVERPLKKGEVYISPQRRKALEDAGLWDDPKLRQRFLKRYSDYDQGRG